MSAMGPSGNPFQDRARALKVHRLALILWEAGLRRSAEVRRLGADQRELALRILGAGMGSRTVPTASAETWRGVASMVGWLGGSSGGRRSVRIAGARPGSGPSGGPGGSSGSSPSPGGPGGEGAVSVLQPRAGLGSTNDMRRDLP